MAHLQIGHAGQELGSSAMASREPAGSLAAAPAIRGKGKKVQGVLQLTLGSPEVVARPERCRWRRILAAASSVTAEGTATAAATPGVSGRFRGRGGRGRRGGAGGELREGRGDAERQREATAVAPSSVTGSSSREGESTKRRRRKKRRGGVASRGCSRGVLLGLQAASRRWHSGGPAQDTQGCCLLEEEETKILQKTP
jgi:hypothetical protein